GNTWLMLKIYLDIKEKKLFKDFLFTSLMPENNFESFQFLYIQKSLEKLSVELLEVFLYICIFPSNIEIKYFNQNFYTNTLTLAENLFLFEVEDETYTVNGYMKNIALLELAKSHIVADLMKKIKINNKQPIKLTLQQQIQKYEFLHEKIPFFAPYIIKLSNAYNESGSHYSARTILKDSLLDVRLNEKGRKLIYKQLAQFCNTFEDVKKLIEELEYADDEKMNKLIFNSYLSKSKTYEESQVIFEKMKQSKVPIGKFAYTMLVKRTENFEQAYQLFQEMKINKIPIANLAIKIILKRTENFIQAQNFFKELKNDANIHISINNINLYLYKAKTFEQATEVFNEMKAMQIEPDATFYNHYLNKTETFEQATVVFNEMKTFLPEIPIANYNYYLNKTETFEQATVVFNEMKTSFSEISILNYNIYLNKTETFKQATEVFNEIKLVGIKSDIITYNTYLNKTETFEQAEAIFNELKALFVKADEYTFFTYLGKCQTFAQTEKVFNEMKSMQVQPNMDNYYIYLQKTLNLTQAKKIFNEMKENNIQPNLKSYCLYLNKANDFTEAKNIIEEMKENNIKPNEVIYNIYINKIQTFKEAEYVYMKYLQQFPLIKGNYKSEKNYNYLFPALLKKVRTLQDFWYVEDELKRLDFKINDYTRKIYTRVQRRVGAK
ncbi:MAG: hypothetical protein JJT94_13200, partial [Bernardetiaceae bacterium]|nr:hypothetical protein [Bernardetiaceae bacterium]